MKILTFPLGAMRTNCYFLIDTASNKAVVVDPAYDAAYIERKLADNSLALEYIILTHAHFDHMMALSRLRSDTGAPLLIGEADAQTLSQPEHTYMKQYALKNEGEAPANRLLRDGDTINLGGEKIKVMLTPGHTRGSLCLVADRDIITGDTLFRGDVGRCDLYGGDEAALKKSLTRIAALDGDYKLHPGHGASTTLDYERRNNENIISL